MKAQMFNFPWQKKTHTRLERSHGLSVPSKVAQPLRHKHLYGFPDEDMAYAYVQIRSDVEVLMAYVKTQTKQVKR